ncbi:MAG: hypothetical protein IPP17_25080 [Bacteroidetes bacterium]|nr:hypothetical protein [Bacteroidota bacterium]
MVDGHGGNRFAADQVTPIPKNCASVWYNPVVVFACNEIEDDIDKILDFIDANFECEVYLPGSQKFGL